MNEPAQLVPNPTATPSTDDGTPAPTTEASSYTPNPDVFGAPGDDGRPANVPEKFWKAMGEGDDAPKGLDVNGILDRANHLESRLGAFAEGAPEEGYKLPDLSQVIPQGSDYELTADNPMVEGFFEVAKDLDIGQASMDKIMAWYAQAELNQMKDAQDAGQLAAQEQINRIHPDRGQEMLETMTQWVKNSLEMDGVKGPDAEAILQGYSDAVVSAESYKLIEYLGNKIRGDGGLPSVNDTKPGGGMNADQVRAMQNEVYPEGHPQAGQRLYDHDPAHRQKVSEAWADVVGEGPRKEQVDFKR